MHTVPGTVPILNTYWLKHVKESYRYGSGTYLRKFKEMSSLSRYRKLRYRAYSTQNLKGRNRYRYRWYLGKYLPYPRYLDTVPVPTVGGYLWK